MTRSPRKRSTKRRLGKSRVRCLRFECYEERVLLATTPVSELIAATQVDVDVIPADTVLVTDPALVDDPVLVDEANDTAATAAALAATETPEAVSFALKITQPGEGRFEGIGILGNLFTDSGVVNNAVTLGDSDVVYGQRRIELDFRYDDSEATETVPHSRFAWGAVSDAFDEVVGSFLKILPALQTHNSNTISEMSQDAELDGYDFHGDTTIRLSDAIEVEGAIHGTKFDTSGANVVFDLQETYTLNLVVEDLAMSPPQQAVLAVGEIQLQQQPAAESELAHGEGEFVRLSVSTPTERLESEPLPDTPTTLIVNDQRAAPGPRAVHVSTETRRHESRVRVASAAWDVQLMPVRTVALAFDASEAMMLPTIPTQRSFDDEGDSQPVPFIDRGASEQATPAAEAPVLPPADSVSYLRAPEKDPKDSESQPYLAVSPLLAAIAGSMLVKDRWQKLQPRDEKRERRKSR